MYLLKVPLLQASDTSEYYVSCPEDDLKALSPNKLILNKKDGNHLNASFQAISGK